VAFSIKIENSISRIDFAKKDQHSLSLSLSLLYLSARFKSMNNLYLNPTKKIQFNLFLRSLPLPLAPYCQFHQRFWRAFFVRNFWCLNFKPKSQLSSFWRQNSNRRRARKTLMKLTLPKIHDALQSLMRRLFPKWFQNTCSGA